MPLMNLKLQIMDTRYLNSGNAIIIHLARLRLFAMLKTQSTLVAAVFNMMAKLVHHSEYSNSGCQLKLFFACVTDINSTNSALT
jgi:hypothetical protein